MPESVQGALQWLNLLMLPMAAYAIKAAAYIVQLEARLARMEAELRILIRSNTDFGA